MSPANRPDMPRDALGTCSNPLKFERFIGRRVHIKLFGSINLGSLMCRGETLSELREFDAEIVGVEGFGLWLKSEAFRPIWAEGAQESRWEAELSGDSSEFPADLDFPVFLPFPMIFLVIPRDDPA